MVVAAMHVVVVMAVAMMTAVPSAAVIAAFVQREFVAHRDINFTHSVSIKARKSGRPKSAAGEKIIIKSSNVNIFHQIIIIHQLSPRSCWIFS
jgi:hypothetical protein